MRGAEPRRRRSRADRRRVPAVLAAAAVAAGMVTACGPEGGDTVNVYYAPEDNFQSVVDACNAEAGGRYRMVYRKLPRDADGQREQMVRRLAAGDDGLDILGLDVTWTPEFAEAGWAAEWTGENKAKATAGVLPGPLKTAQWNGKLYAAPKNTNVQLLWTDDRTAPTPPTTWDQMMADAKRLKAAGKPGNVLFTGAQYDGYIALFNTLVQSAGGQLLTDDGKAVDPSPASAAAVTRALEVLKQVSTQGITDPSLSNQKEDDVRNAFQNKKGAFQLNWPFVYASMGEEKPQDQPHLRWSRYPEVKPGTPSKSTIGGYDLAVSTQSKKKQQAFEGANCLRSAKSQRFSALKDGLPPSIEGIYSDGTPLDPSKPVGSDNPSMATKYPMRQTILDALKDPGVRPRTPAYQTLSTVLQKVISPPSSIDPPVTAQRLRAELSEALQSKGVIP